MAVREQDVAVSPDLGSVLIVDDEFSMRDSLVHWFEKDGYRTGSAQDGREALQRLDEQDWDAVLLDIKMPGMDGLELQRRIREVDPDLPIIMITAFASVDSAVQALKEGAFDYVTKPIDPDELSHLVRRAVEKRRLQRENAQLRRNVDQLSTPTTIVGASGPMSKVLELVASVAQTDATVLIRGESGTGKELIAQTIHANSRRRYFPIVPVNCGAIPESLLESELFGHEKGAFTGAQYRRKGKLEMADGGSLFLDEVGTISLPMQVNLLRVLETKEFSIPPLRERRQDIPLLAQHLLGKYAAEMNRPFTGFDPAAMDLMVRYEWPGNVRELANAVERALVVGRGPLVAAEDLPMRLNEKTVPPAGDSLADVEKAQVRAILERTGGNVTRSAEILGIDRVTLYNKIKKYGLRP